ncbi:hypothetical protein Trydic_g729 [Trypoxylus dichotomus]
MLALADIIDIIGTSTGRVKDQLLGLEKESQKMGLTVNEEKNHHKASSGSEIRTMMKDNKAKLKCFERKAMRKIYGPATSEFRRRTNKELEKLYKDANIVQERKTGRLGGQKQQDSRMTGVV